MQKAVNIHSFNKYLIAVYIFKKLPIKKWFDFDKELSPNLQMWTMKVSQMQIA